MDGHGRAEAPRDDAEVVLHGGNTNVVVRVGDTVRRTSGPWTRTVHALLRHLEAGGFDAAPRPLGLDAQGREVLSFIEGEAVNYPMPSFVWSDATLADVGRLLRRYHDVSAGFSVADARWRAYASGVGPPEVICHCDWGPYNGIFRNDRLVAMVDWDFARPGSRLSDLTYAAYTWVPIQASEQWDGQPTGDAVGQARRLRLLCDAYAVQDPSAVLPALRERLAGLANWVEELAAEGDAGLLKLLDSFRVALQYLEARWSVLEGALR